MWRKLGTVGVVEEAEEVWDGGGVEGEENRTCEVSCDGA